MINKSFNNRSGLTIIEAMVVISIVAVTVIGSSAYQYGAAMDSRKADLNTTAVRTALMLCEGWAGAGGDTAFNPVNTFGPELDISNGTGPDVPGGFTKLGSFIIKIEDIPYYATLSWKASGTNGMKAINVVVRWEQHGHKTSTINDTDKSYQLTTYTKKQV